PVVLRSPLILAFFSLFFYSPLPLLSLHSFPTRRSSDLLSLAPGRTLGVVGESGCGKTMLSRAVLQLLPKRAKLGGRVMFAELGTDRKSTRLNSSHLGISYAVFCLKKKKIYN